MAEAIEATPKIGLISAAADREIASAVQQGLADLGVAVAEVGQNNGPFDAVIVLVSFEAVHDRHWNDRVAILPPPERIVPVQLSITADFAMPDVVAQRNWVRYPLYEPAAAVAEILAGLRTDESRHRRRRQLETEAASWEQQDCDSGMLIGDFSRAREAAALGEELEASSQAFSPTARAFITASLPYARRRRRTRRFVALAVLVAVASAITGGLALLPGIFQARVTQEAGFITTPDPSFVADNPSWAAMLAAELVVHPASEAQLIIARDILRSTLARRWSLGVVVSVDHQLLAAVPKSDGATVIALLQRPSGIGVLAALDLPSGAWMWSAELGQGYSSIDLGLDEERAVVGGVGGIAVVDLTSHRVRSVSDEAVVDVADAGDIIYALSPSDEAMAVAADDGTITEVGSFGSPLDMSRTSSGVRGVFVDGAGEYALVALDDGGRSVVHGTVPRPLIEAATLSDDGTSAFIAGGDHQLWSLGASGPMPTGIAVPDRIGLLLQVGGGRLAIGGGAQPLRVFDAASGYELGEACSDIRGPTSVRVSADGSVIVCVNEVSASAWATPLGPEGEVDAPRRTEPFENNPIFDVESSGASIRFFFHTTGDLGRYTGWIPLARGSVTAVAIAPDASKALIGTDAGEVFVYAVGESEVNKVVDWRTPDRSPVEAVAWSPEPLVLTAAGVAWRTPDCGGCASDEGMLSVLQDRLPRCWSETQLSLLSSEVRRRLGVEACIPRAEGA